MAQPVQTKTDSSLSSSGLASSLFSALKSGSNLGGQTGGVFSSILDAADSAIQQMKNTTNFGSSSKTVTASASVQRPETAPTSGEDTAAVTMRSSDRKPSNQAVSAQKDKDVQAQPEGKATKDTQEEVVETKEAKPAESGEAKEVAKAENAEDDVADNADVEVGDKTEEDQAMMALLLSVHASLQKENTQSETKDSTEKAGAEEKQKDQLNADTSAKEASGVAQLAKIEDLVVSEAPVGAVPFGAQLATAMSGKEELTVMGQNEAASAAQSAVVAGSPSLVGEDTVIDEETAVIAQSGEDEVERSTLSYQASNDNSERSKKTGAQNQWSPEMLAASLDEPSQTQVFVATAPLGAMQTATNQPGDVAGSSSAVTATSSQAGSSVPVGLADRPVGSYSFASQLSAAGSDKQGSTTAAQVVEQVAVQINKGVKGGKDEMTINLRPAELGKIEVKLTFTSDNKVHGTVIADKAETLQMLQKDSDTLNRALQDAGLRTDSGSLQFSLRDNGQSNAFAQSKSDERFGSNSFTGKSEAEAADLLETQVNVETYYVTPGRVNLRV